MTNEEIINKLGLDPKNYFLGKCILTRSDYMNQARKDERDTLIGEIEKFIIENECQVYGHLNRIDTHEILSKLNELRKEGIV